MYSVSSNFLTAIKNNSRQFKAKVSVGSVNLDETSVVEFSIENLLSTQGLASIGGVPSSKLTIKFLIDDIVPSNFTTQKISPSIGLLVGSTYEYVPLGVFIPNINSVTKDKTTVSVECFDSLYYTGNMDFTSSLTYPATVLSVLTEMETTYSVTFPNKTSLPSATIKTKPTGVKVRDVLGDIAELTSTNAVMGRTGGIEFRFKNTTTFALDTNNYINFKLTGDGDVNIVKLICEKSGKDQSNIEYGSGSGYTFTFKNDSVTTSAELKTIYDRVYPFTYTPFECNMQGMPHLDVGDIINITDINAVSRNLIILSHKLTFNGGLNSVIKANAPSQTSTSSGSTTNSLTKTVNNMYTDVMVSKDILAGNITADNIKANSIGADKLKAKTLTADSGVFGDACIDSAQIKSGAITTAKIGDAQITGAKIADASIASAKIIDGSISNAKIADAQITGAKIAKATIDGANIKNGAITTALIGTGAINTAQIADGSITSAKIVDLTANKITSGTLTTDRLVIRGANNSIVYELNNITGGLQSKNVDTLNGEIITDRTIKADKLVANTITANEIASKTITANQIASNTITAGEIKSGTITANQIASNTITASNLVSDIGSTLDLSSNTAITSKVNSSQLTDAINGIKVGGRNLIKNSNWCDTATATSPITNGSRLVCLIDGFNINSMKGKEYTFSYMLYRVGSFQYPSTAPDSGQNRFSMCGVLTWHDSTGVNADYTVYPFAEYASSEYTDSARVSMTYKFTPPTGYDTISYFDIPYYTYAYPSSTNNATWKIGYPKLEEGNKATDWTSAPEDVQASIDAVDYALNQTTNSIGGQIDAVNTRVTNAESLITQTKDDITSTVKNDYSTKTEVGSIKTNLESNIRQSASDLTTTFTSQVNGVSGDLASYKQEVQSNIRFSDNGIELGKSNSEFKTLLTNEKLAFKQGGDEVAYVSNQKLNISKGQFMGEFIMGEEGKWEWVVRENGNLTLMYGKFS